MASTVINVRVKISGVTPLLMNRFPDGDPNKPKSSLNGDRGTPREQADPKAYKLLDGTLYIPGPNIYAGLIDTGRFHKVGKRQLTTQKSSLIPSGIFLLDAECSLSTKDFEVDSRPVVIPSTGGKIMCHRPRLDKWETEFSLQIDTAEFAENLVRQLVIDLGRKIGLGDFRPQRKGPFGRFDVVGWVIEST